MSKKYYQKDNIVDYDILDYLSFNDFNRNNKPHVQVKTYVRIIYYENNKLISKYIDDVFVLERHKMKLCKFWIAQTLLNVIIVVVLLMLLVGVVNIAIVKLSICRNG